MKYKKLLLVEDGSVDMEKIQEDLKQEPIYIIRYRQGAKTPEVINLTKERMKTCKNETENNPVDEFICSECGFMTAGFSEKRIDKDFGDMTYYEFEIKYCPKCGTKVV